MSTVDHAKSGRASILRIALAVSAAFGLTTGAQAQQAATSAKPHRVELAPIDIAGSFKHAQGRYVEFPAGFKSPTALHAGEEIVYVVAGDYTLTIEGQSPKQYKGGDSFSISRGIRHGFTTAGGATLVAFWVVDNGLPLDLNPEK